ncbi:phage portal protein [Oscillospiraceae bacterium LTW-04]|nr:phage portal protein [Oscillospiraceae bacterium MB24-C1]
MPKLLEKLLRESEDAHAKKAALAREARSYYENNNAVCRSGAAAIAEVNGYLRKLGKNPLHSADNRIPTNWHRIITDQKIGYLLTYPPQLDAPGNELAAKELVKALGGDYPKVAKLLGVDATNCGAGWLAYWYDANDAFCYWPVPPEQIRPVYDSDSIKPRLKYLIRSVNSPNSKTMRHELWTDHDVTYYTVGENGVIARDATMGENGVMAHRYGAIPFIEFRNNGDGVGDLPMYRALVDAIDKLVSGFANDIDDMQEIIWVIKNYAGETAETDYDQNGNPVPREIDLLQKLKAKKLISVDGDGGVDTLRGEIPFEARCAFLDILIRQLYISAMAVNPFPDAIGQASGVYIDFLYSLLELKAGLMETEFRSGFDALAKAALHCGRLPDAQIEQVWTRNKPRNESEVVQMISGTDSTVLSNETKTKAHPLAENWQQERARIAREQGA